MWQGCIVAKSATSFKAGATGNKAGRPAGTTPRARFRKLVEADMPAIVETLVASAKAGDVQAAKVLIDRLIPALKPTAADLSLRTTGTLTEKGEHVIRAMLTGHISPDAAKVSLDVLTAQAKLIEQSEVITRLAALEALLCPSSKS